MTDAAMPAAPRRRGILPLAVGGVLAVALGTAGFVAARSGLLPLPAAAPAPAAAPGRDAAFVPVPPVIVTLGPGSRHRHLRFVAQLEVAPAEAAAVERLMPRVLDVLNGYLRAVEPAELEQTGALFRLRAQMLRRIRTVVGEGRVHDLLVTEFVLN